MYYCWYNYKKWIIFIIVGLVLVITGVIVALIFNRTSDNILDGDDGTSDLVETDNPLQSTNGDFNLNFTDTESAEANTIIKEYNSKATKEETEFFQSLSETEQEKYKDLATKANLSFTGESFNEQHQIYVKNRIESLSTIQGLVHLIDGSAVILLVIPEDMNIPSQWLGARLEGTSEVYLAIGSSWAGYRLTVPNVSALDTIIIDLATRLTS